MPNQKLFQNVANCSEFNWKGLTGQVSVRELEELDQEELEELDQEAGGGCGSPGSRRGILIAVIWVPPHADRPIYCSQTLLHLNVLGKPSTSCSKTDDFLNGP